MVDVVVTFSKKQTYSSKDMATKVTRFVLNVQHY